MTLTVYRNFKAPRLERTQYNRGPFVYAKDCDLRDGAIRPFRLPTAGSDDPRVGIPAFCDNTYYHVEDDLLLNERGNLTGVPVLKSPPVVDTSLLNFSAGNDQVNLEHTGVDTQSKLHRVKFCYTIAFKEPSYGWVESAPSPAGEQDVPLGTSVGVVKVTVPGVATVAPNFVDKMDWSRIEYRLYVTDVIDTDLNDGQPIDLTGGDWGLLEVSDTNKFDIDIAAYTQGILAVKDILRTNDPYLYPAPFNVVDAARTEDGIVVVDRHRLYVSEPASTYFTMSGTVEIDNIVRGVAALGNTVLVMTDGFLYQVNYKHTQDGVAVDRATIKQWLPLLSKESISAWGSSVWFAATTGLYQWDTGGYGADVRNVSGQIMKQENWKAIADENVVGVAVEDGYLFYCPAVDMSYKVSRRGDGWEMMPLTFLKMKNPDYRDGVVYYQDYSSGESMEWRMYDKDVCYRDVPGMMYGSEVNPQICNTDSYQPYTFGLFVDEEGRSVHTVARVEFDENSADGLEFEIIDDYFGQRASRAKVDIVSSRPVNLPSGRSNQTVVLELRGKAVVSEVRLANSRRELVNRSNRSVDAGA